MIRWLLVSLSRRLRRKCRNCAPSPPEACPDAAAFDIIKTSEKQQAGIAPPRGEEVETKMANLCSYEMRVKGTPEAVDEMELRLTDPDHAPRFRRVTDTVRTDEKRDGDLLVTSFSGACAWSVATCMLESPLSYASSEEANVTTSLCQTASELGLEIEVYADEISSELAEHYHYAADGTVLAEEEARIEEVWWDRDYYQSFEELSEDYDLAERGITEADFEGEESICIGGFDMNWAF